MDARAQRDRFMAFSFASADLLIETDAEGRIGFVVGASSGLGVPSGQSLDGEAFDDLFREGDRGLIRNFIASVRPGRRFGPLHVSPKGRDRTVTLYACSLPNLAGKRHIAVSYAEAAARAVSAMRAERDDATGLVAKADFEEVAADTVKRLKEAGRDVRLTLMNLEEQGEFVKRLGNEAGGQFLADIGAVLRSVSAGDAAAQVADGRYSIVHEAGVDGDIIRRSIEEVALKADPEGKGLKIAANTLQVDEEMSSEDAARALVYTVSSFQDGANSGFNLETVGDALNAAMKDTSKRIVEFKKFIAEDRIKFVAQPIVHLSDRVISHYEMLVRFEDGKSPFEMVTFAEKTGIVEDLDFAAFKKAVLFLERAAAPEFPGLSVNLSGRSLASQSFVTQLCQLLDRTEMDRPKLSFEITESSAIMDFELADRAISAIRKHGHMVALDDFGAGAASFPYLRMLEVDAVKIDGAYVRDSLTNKRDAALLKAMIGLCRDLKVITIAEMVETEAHVRYLRQLHVDKGQGWLFGRPVPLKSLAAGRARAA
jgi:EAL domain-containing protein (putative c-di-GMP-specific phosphodiesterase class I)